MAARLLGAVLAGGLSRRFGSDKALALIDGCPMIEHVIAAIRPQVDELVICGRTWANFESLVDHRIERIGPLAGLETALHYAKTHHFDAVLTVPVDTLPIPSNLSSLLSGDGPAVLSQQYLIGYWPVGYRDGLTAFLDGGLRSVREWITQRNARRVDEPMNVININNTTDLLNFSVSRRAAAVGPDAVDWPRRSGALQSGEAPLHCC